MNPGYDILRITKFLVHPLSLRHFCMYYRRKREQEVGKDLPALDYGDLAGGTPQEKADYLVDQLERGGHLTNLVFHLTNYWFVYKGEPADVFCKDGLHEDLCIAAQDLWKKSRADAMQSFDRLKDIDDDFGHEWKDARTALEDAPSLEPIKKGLDTFVAHLKDCREQYADATKHYENRRYEDARAAFERLEKLQPRYRYHDVQDKLNEINVLLAQSEELYHQANKHYAAHEYEEAETAYKKLPAGYRDKDVQDKLKEIEALLFQIRYQEHYTRATSLRGAHQLLQARAQYIELAKLQDDNRDALNTLQALADKDAVRQLQEIVKEVDGWVKRLKDEDAIARLQTIIDAAQTGIVYDDRLPWGAGYPYRLFQQLGASITPRSSMDEVEAALRQLDEQQTTPEQRASLETLLKSEEQRLLADVFLYPICPSEATAHSIVQTFLDEGRLPTPAEIIERYPEEAGALLFLIGQSEAAAQLWEAAQRNRPLDVRMAHCQGLLYLGQAHATDVQDSETAIKYWRAAIGNWAIALADTTSAYWITWGRERGQCYQRSVVLPSIASLGSRVQDQLQHVLLSYHDRLAAEGATTQAQEIEQIAQELAIEFAAVRLSQAMGGIEIEPGRLAWFGPLWMAHYGRQQALAKHIATFVPDESQTNLLLGRLSPAEALRRLRWYFSYLRTAAILLEDPTSDPTSVLAALEESACSQAPACNDRQCPLHGEAKFPVVVCCPHWDQFAAYNPAYTGLQNPQAQMCDDALQLAIEAHMRLARMQISNGKIKDRDKLRSAWRTLLNFAQHTNNPAGIHQRICNVVLEETRLSATNEAYLNAAITLLEFSLGILAIDNPEHPLKIRLAELLADRGTIKMRQGAVSDAEADLKRALNVAPQIHDTRAKLALLWFNQASNVVHSDRFEALNYLRQAAELIEKGQQDYPGYDYTSVLDLIKRSQQNLIPRVPQAAGTGAQPAATQTPFRVWNQPVAGEPTSDVVRLYGQGVRELRDSRPEEALRTFGRALDKDPQDADMQAAATDALLENAARLIDQDDPAEHQKGLDLLRQWMPRLPRQKARLERQLEFLTWWPNIRFCLKEQKSIPHTIHDYQEVRIPFQAKNIDSDTVWVRIQVEGDSLCLTAPLPLFSAAEAATVMGNLLQASRKIMLFKIAASGDDLILKGRLPFRLLTPDWFFLAALEISDYADISHDQLNRADKLFAWFQERQAWYVQDIGNADHLTKSGKSIEKLCRDHNLACKRLTDVRYEVQAAFGRVEMEAWPDGVRLVTRLGRLNENPNRQQMLARLVELNFALQAGKLALDEQMTVVLSVELPYLDEPLAGEAFTLLEQTAIDLKPELVQPA